jgi:hypothetical protein
MRLLAVLFLFFPALHAQTCVAVGRLAPNDSVTGSIDENSCRLGDGAAYAAYSMVLPVRGQLQLDAQSDAFGAAVILRDAAGHALASGASIRTAAEAGSYTIVIHTANNTDTGAFQVRSGFSPEADTYCRAAAPLGLNQSVQGRLAAGNCRTPDGTAYDMYELVTLGSGTLDIAMTSDDFAGYVVLRGADGHPLATSDNGRLSYLLGGDQRYVVVAMAADSGSGAYRLALNFTPADGESCRAVKAFVQTDDDSGKITPDGCAIEDPDTGGRAYYNYYDVKVAEAGLAEVRMTSAAFNPSVYLLDESGSLVASDSGTAGKGQALLRRQLRPGNYTLLAFSSIGVAADYAMHYGFSPGPPAAPQVQAIESGATVSGRLSADSSARTAEGLADLYSITTPAPGRIDLKVSSTDFTPWLVLRDMKDNRIVADQYATGQIAADLPAGTYSIVAATADAAGAYTLAYQFTARTQAPCPTPTALAAGYVGLLGPDSCRSANGQPADYYQFTTTEEGSTAITMTSWYLYSSLTIEDAQGNVVRRDENGLGGGDSLVVQFLPGQTYKVTARGADGTPAGYYEIRRYFAAGRPAGCKPVRSIAAGDDFDAQLNFTACQYPDDTFADIYQLDVGDTAQFQITMQSGDFDAYLLVLDGKGNVVAEDDDGAEAANAMVSSTLNPGTYFVVAKSAAGYTGGGYRLNVAAVPQAVEQ